MGRGHHGIERRLARPLGHGAQRISLPPEKHPWVQADPFLFFDFPGYTLKIMAENILRVRVRFDKAERVPWEVNMSKFFGR